jgi:hypothetical protein
VSLVWLLTVRFTRKYSNRILHRAVVGCVFEWILWLVWGVIVFGRGDSRRCFSPILRDLLYYISCHVVVWCVLVQHTTYYIVSDPRQVSTFGVCMWLGAVCAAFGRLASTHLPGTHHALPTSYITHPFSLVMAAYCLFLFEPSWLFVIPALCTEVCGVVRVDMRPARGYAFG